MEQSDALLSIALDLSRSLASGDRYARLLKVVRKVIPCDAAAVLELDGDDLVPVATYGLAPEVLSQRFRRSEHPRLEVIVSKAAPVSFPADSSLPDPFDGLVLVAPGIGHSVHACLGCPLLESGRVIGVLTADAVEPGAFGALDEHFLQMLGALAGATMHTARLLEALERASQHHRSVARDLQRDASTRSGGQILGISPAIQRVRQEIDLVAASDFAVLITGETGVGKELVARAIHDSSTRRDEAMIYLNCAALPESIAESELFGHVRGAFTGASADRAGKFEIADKGTLFLDEVGELPLSVQAKLLRVLQEGEIQRVGSDRRLEVDVRVLAATNRNLQREIEAGRFRADLYHRLNMYPIEVPPLRRRRDDIVLLAEFFLDSYRRKLGLGPVVLTRQAKQALQSSPWPGNVRELDNVLGRAILRCAADSGHEDRVVVGIDRLQLSEAGAASIAPEEEKTAAADAGPTLAEAVEDLKRRMVSRAVAEAGGNWAAAARALGMQRGNLHHMARRLGLREGNKQRAN